MSNSPSHSLMQGTVGYAIRPEVQAEFQAAGLISSEAVLNCQGTVINGHPNRQVRLIQINEHRQVLLKVEEHTAWKQRVLNAFAGFGFASLARRESVILSQLEGTSIHAPRWLAWGEHRGRAFLALEIIPDVVSLRRYLEMSSANDQCRVAKDLGVMLADLHAMGINHPDLYDNHILVHPVTHQVWILDWQRSRKVGRITDAQRMRDLAALTATLPEAMASELLRSRCLKAYQRRCDCGASFRDLVCGIAQYQAELRKRRHVQAKLTRTEQSQQQSLISLDGEQLQITSLCQEIWPDDLPIWLVHRKTGMHCHSTTHGQVALECAQHPAHSSTWISPQRARMNLLHRLQQHGITAPLVLAVGDRFVSPARVESFVLSLAPPGGLSLSETVAARGRNREAMAQLLKTLGAFMAQLHRAGCFFQTTTSGLMCRMDQPWTIVVGNAEDLIVKRGRDHRSRVSNLTLLVEELGLKGTDRARVIRSYLVAQLGAEQAQRAWKTQWVARLIRANRQ